MDDLDLIRRFAEESGEPDAGARARVVARLERRMWGRSSDGAASAGGAVRTASRRRRLRRLTIVAAAAAVLLAASFGAVQLLRPNAAEASVQFSRDDGYIVANIIDPYVAQDELRAAFADRGLDIDLELLPVSPSIVGTVVFIDGRGIETLIGTKYQGPRGEQPVGLRVPADFKGHATIVLGRPAKPGEAYDSAGDAFAPGEALRGVDLVGMKVGAAVRLLHEIGVTAVWRVDAPVVGGQNASEGVPVAKPTATAAPAAGSSASPSADAEIPEGSVSLSTPVDGVGIKEFNDYYVTDAVPRAPGSVFVFAAARAPEPQQQ